MKVSHMLAATTALAGTIGAVFALQRSDHAPSDVVRVVSARDAAPPSAAAANSAWGITSTASAETDGAMGWTAATTQSSCTTPIAPAPTPDPAATASFGVTMDNVFYTVDTGAGLVFKIRRGNYAASTLAPGDIASMVYKGLEYQNQTAGTQLNIGAGFLYKGVTEDDVTLSAERIGTDYIKITVTAGDLTHYYIAHRGEAKIYMGTVFSREPEELNLVRYIVRAQKARVPNGPPQSDLKDTTKAIEASDIFSLPNGETRSKHYANDRLRDWYYIGATGTNVGLWVVRGNSEQMVGGPFYRSLLNQGTDVDQQITYIINYDMAQTEPYRVNALNTYALVFTDGTPPAPIDTSWYGGLGLKGWTDPAGRGAVWGTGVTAPPVTMTRGAARDGNVRYTVGFSNANAQYYTTPDRSGAFRCEGMLPGTYTLSVFKNELLVGSQPVTVTAGGTTAAGTPTLTDPSAVPALWRIGTWDGTPLELRNGGLVTRMHPSDVRMTSWTPGPFTVGTVGAADFPAYQWKAINNDQIVRFRLTAEQLKASRVRIGITTALNGGRPMISVNSWVSPLTSPSNQPKTRNLTVGTYRGNNTLYTFNVPASALVEGENTMKITVISGTVADAWLSPAISYDAIDFIQ